MRTGGPYDWLLSVLVFGFKESGHGFPQPRRQFASWALEGSCLKRQRMSLFVGFLIAGLESRPFAWLPIARFPFEFPDSRTHLTGMSSAIPLQVSKSQKKPTNPLCHFHVHDVHEVHACFDLIPLFPFVSTEPELSPADGLSIRYSLRRISANRGRPPDRLQFYQRDMRKHNSP
jgi:hypothetical protein